MKHLSYIFSFDTLKFSFRLPRAWILGLSIVLVASLATQYLTYRGVLFSSIPRAMVESKILEMKEDHQIWLVGNSTLHSGINITLLRKSSPMDCVKLVMGSATFNAMAELVSHGLCQTSHFPQAIILFISKDDFNVNGDRGISSRQYIHAMNDPGLIETILTYIPVYSCRYSIRKSVFSILEKLPDLIRPNITTASNQKNASISYQSPAPKKWKDFSNNFEKTYLANLGRDYSMDISSLKPLAEACKSKGIQLGLVFVPMTRAAVLWQEKYASYLPWPMIQKNIKDQCAASGIKVIDCWNMFPSTGQYFSDEYHLTPKGRDDFTQHFSEKLNSILSPCQPPSS